MSKPYPSLCQINTRVWLTELRQKLGRPATLDDIPDAELDHLARMGFDWVWFLSVWQTGPAGQRVSRSNPEWQREFKETLPDLRQEDIAGSGFAITGYTVHELLGGDAALARLRERLRERNLRLMLDFVPNHTGLDHPWVEDHPDYYIHGNELDLARAPRNYTRISRKQGDLLLAYGRDPYFPGWPDTIQLNYGNPATQEAMIGELIKIANQCDGLRCDMAMLVLPEVFERTWGIHPQPFWPEATRQVREHVPHFCFMAEVYWDLEWTLQQQGFNYTYDKRLYDRLRDGHARPVREHFLADSAYQNKLARFLEKAAGGCYLCYGNSSGCSNSYLSVSRIAVLSRGPIPGAPQAHFSPSLSPPLRACRPAVGAILRPPACPVASTDRPGRTLAIT